MFGFSFWLLGCSIPSSKSSFPPPNQAASAARRIFISSDPNVCVHPRRTLCAVVVERLVGPDFFIFRSEREGEGRKWAENAQNRPVRAVRGHFGPIFHHFSVLEPSRGHFCITFLLNWVPRSFPRRCVIPRAEFSFLRSNVRVHPRHTLCDVGCNALFGFIFMAVHALDLS